MSTGGHGNLHDKLIAYLADNETKKSLGSPDTMVCFFCEVAKNAFFLPVYGCMSITAPRVHWTMFGAYVSSRYRPALR